MTVLDRFAPAIGLALGAVTGLAIYAAAEWLAVRWNPFL